MLISSLITISFLTISASAASYTVPVDEPLLVLEHVLLENSYPLMSMGRKKRATVTASIIPEIISQLSDTGCWCTRLPDWTNMHGHGDALDQYDRGCKGLAQCEHYSKLCLECSRMASSGQFTFDYQEPTNSFTCSGNPCDIELCECQMNWATRVVNELAVSGRQMISDSDDLNVDFCPGSSSGGPMTC